MKKVICFLFALTLFASFSLAETIDIDSLNMEETFALIQQLYDHVTDLTYADSEYVVFYYPQVVQAKASFWFQPGTYILMAADDDAYVIIGSKTYVSTFSDIGKHVDPYCSDYKEYNVRIGKPITVTILEGQYIELQDAGLLLKKVPE